MINLQQKTFSHCTGALSRKFHENVWMHDVVRDRTNCYAYALNIPEAMTAQPGQLLFGDLINYPYRSITQRHLESALDFDGLMPLTEQQAKSDNHPVIIALRFQTYEDYHFFRKKEDGNWTHKQIECVPHELDDDLKKIKNPRRARISAYTNFGGYYTVPEDGIFYIKHIEYNLG